MNEWLLVTEYQVGLSAATNEPWIWLTFDEREQSRSATQWPNLERADFLAMCAILRLNRPRWAKDNARNLKTTREDVTSFVATEQQKPTISDFVREFDASWAVGSGGWLLLRLRDAQKFKLKEFGAVEGDLFAAWVEAASRQLAFFDPFTGSVRGYPHAGPPDGDGMWGTPPQV